MQDHAIRAGCEAARQTIVDETRPRTEADAREIEDLLLGLRAALAGLGDRSVYQAVAAVLARSSLAGGIVSRIAPERRLLVAGRIGKGFALAHLRVLAIEARAGGAT